MIQLLTIVIQKSENDELESRKLCYIYEQKLADILKNLTSNKKRVIDFAMKTKDSEGFIEQQIMRLIETKKRSLTMGFDEKVLIFDQLYEDIKRRKILALEEAIDEAKEEIKEKIFSSKYDIEKNFVEAVNEIEALVSLESF